MSEWRQEFSDVKDWDLNWRVQSGIDDINDAFTGHELTAAMLRQIRMLTEQNARQQAVIDELRGMLNI